MNLNETELFRIKRNIIKKLYSNKCFQNGHLLLERLQSGIPSHLTGFVIEVLDDLVKAGIVLHYGKTKHGDAYQLNIQKLGEIEKLISG